MLEIDSTNHLDRVITLQALYDEDLERLSWEETQAIMIGVSRHDTSAAENVNSISSTYHRGFFLLSLDD